MKQSCQIYFRPDGVYVFSQNRTTTGLWIGNGFGDVLLSPSADNLTHAIKKALAKSEDNVPLPADIYVIPSWVRERKLKSWNAVEKGALPFGIQILNLDLVLTHYTPYKGGGFLAGDEENFPADQIDHIGEILLQRSRGSLEPKTTSLPSRPKKKQPAAGKPGLPTLPGTESFNVGDRAIHVFRGECEVVSIGSMKGIIPSVTIRFPNGDLQTLSLPCPILSPHPNQ